MANPKLAPTYLRFKHYNGVLEGVRFVDGLAQKPIPLFRAERFLAIMGRSASIVDPPGTAGAVEPGTAGAVQGSDTGPTGPVSMVAPEGGEGHFSPVLDPTDALIDRMTEDEDLRDIIREFAITPVSAGATPPGNRRGRKGA